MIQQRWRFIYRSSGEPGTGGRQREVSSCNPGNEGDSDIFLLVFSLFPGFVLRGWSPDIVVQQVLSSGWVDGPAESKGNHTCLVLEEENSGADEVQLADMTWTVKSICPYENVTPGELTSNKQNTITVKTEVVTHFVTAFGEAVLSANIKQRRQTKKNLLIP